MIEALRVEIVPVPCVGVPLVVRCPGIEVHRRTRVSVAGGRSHFYRNARLRVGAVLQ